MKVLKLELQLFADGGEGAASATATTAPATEAGVKGDFDAAAAIEAYRESKKPSGKRFNAADHVVKDAAPKPQAEAEQTPAAETTRLPFKDLIKGEYKEEADAYIQALMKERLKNRTDAEKELKELAPALEIIAKSRGIEPGNRKALVENIMQDASFYEDEALKRGVPVESMMEMAQLQREAEEAQARIAHYEAEKQAAELLGNLFRQESEMKQRYPGFDLRSEMQNPKFYEMVTSDRGISVEDAYWVVHRNELVQRVAGNVSQQTRSDVSRSIQSGAYRPMESAAKPGGAAPQVKPDPRNMTSDQIREIKERVRRGERNISFD